MSLATMAFSLAAARVGLENERGQFFFRQQEPVAPHASADPDTERIHWQEAGVNQNLTFPVQPDPASGMHCWHQKVRVERARATDQYGDVMVDTAKSREVYEEWKAMTRPAPGPGGLRRPLHMKRPLRPVDEAYRI